MDQPSEDRAVIDPAAHPTVEGIVQAITSKNAECALAQALGFLRSNQPIDELGRALENLSFGDSLVRPIFHAHAVKVTAAALEEHAALGTQQDREQPILAAVRFLATSFQERRLQENVATAIAWVSEGTIPRKVTQ